MTHPLTHAFATTLLQAKGAVCVEDYEPVADAIAALTEGFSDERKADLYALIHEAVNRDMAFVELTDALDGALTKNEEHFARG